MRLFAGTPYDRPPVCDRCGKLDGNCTCPPLAAAKDQLSPAKQTVRLAVEKRRRGKLVTVVRGLSAGGNDLPAFLKRLKEQCGAGGTLDGDGLEIQGNQLEKLRTLLGDAGYKVRG